MTGLENILECGVDRKKLAVELWRRSAAAYFRAGELKKAGEARLKAGDKNRAAELFLEAGEDLRAAELFFDGQRFAAALACARRCLEHLSSEDFSLKIAARLVAAAACSKSGDKKEAADFLRTARAELAEFTAGLSPFSAAKAWESLARFGRRVERPDLVRLGYEKALSVYGLKFNLQRLRTAHDYLKAAAGDRLLEAEIERRIQEYQRDFTTDK
jgi:tetratricopeptide (TPR) repeat protein